MKISSALDGVLSSRLGANYRLYFNNIGWLVGEKAVQLVLGLLVGIYVARVLGPAQFGLLGYAQGIVAMATAVVTLGLDNIVVKHLVTTPERRDEWLLAAAWMRGLTGIGFVGIAFLYWLLMGNSDSGALYILIFSLALPFSAVTVLALELQAMVASRQTVMARTIQSVISSALRLTFALYRSPLALFAWVGALEGPLFGGLLAYFHRRVARPLPLGGFRLASAVALLREAWPLLISSLAIILYMKMDQVMLKWMVGDGATGVYLAGTKLSELWNFLPVVICSTIFPSLLRVRENDYLKYRVRIQNLYAALYGLALLIIGVIWLTGDYLIRGLFGAEFQSATTILHIHVWSTIAVFLGVASSSWLMAEGLQHISFIQTFLGLVFNLVLNLIFIPRYGAVGAAWATTISYFAATFLGLLIRKKSWPAFMDLLKTISGAYLFQQYQLYRK